MQSQLELAMNFESDLDADTAAMLRRLASRCLAAHMSGTGRIPHTAELIVAVAQAADTIARDDEGRFAPHWLESAYAAAQALAPELELLMRGGRPRFKYESRDRRAWLHLLSLKWKACAPPEEKLRIPRIWMDEYGHLPRWGKKGGRTP